ncbi:transglutaminase-like putative cysteine protease [Methanohalophilus levihalophilus]|uniref:transglutaminase-like domain-containing protein n=1 Tax=Methanohalophilus levihalophilus TaxID=1431282 RepID=UPI001AE2C6E0|nr:transglutaminase family protein [Methanohalophilus levihalophilus]MBP2030998.1 transglutaminase-like putative cysteine protease [Methanohalophilus levihalophilus]
MIRKALLVIIILATVSLAAVTLILTPTLGNYFALIIGDDGVNYSPDPGDLTPPIISGHEKAFEKKPVARSTIPSGYEIESKYFYGKFYQNSDEVIEMQISNLGDNAIFVYGFGLKGPNGISKYDNGYLIEAGDSEKIGLVAFEVPGKDQFSLTPYIYLMAQTESNNWYDYGLQEFKTLEFEAERAPAEVQNPYYSNPPHYFKMVNDRVNGTDPLVRTTAESASSKYSGEYNIYQLCSLFDYLATNVEYVSDPNESDYWATPEETIYAGTGDCEDYAFLMASMVESVGGSSRIYLTDDHAFAAAYLGKTNETDESIEAISEYYNSAPVYYFTDSYGSWIILDASSGMYAGDLPAGAAPISTGWTFLNQTNVTVIDVYQ